MKFKNEIYHITLSGILTGLAIVLGMFAHFPLLNGNIYLVGVIIFLMPLVLPLGYALIGGTLAASLTDVLSGYPTFAWVTAIAYAGAVVIVWLFKLLKFKFLYFIGLILGALFAMATYFVLDWKTADLAYAFEDLVPNTIQFAIVVPITLMLYFPIKLLRKG